MLERLRRHPFAVEAFFRRSLVVTYALPRERLAPLIARGLELDTYDDRWGFLAIAMVETEGLRPRGMPRLLGRDFFLSGYRIFTRFRGQGQPTRRGLYILRSDTDKRMMAAFGNVFTHYNYARASVTIDARPMRLELSIRTPGREADLHVIADLSDGATLPKTSPFRTMDDALSFAGPLPFTFSNDAATGKMVVIKGVRKEWSPRPVAVDVREATFLDGDAFKGADVRLANAFYLEGTAYEWKAGVLEDIA